MTTTLLSIALCLLIQSTVLMTLGLIAMRLARPCCWPGRWRDGCGACGMLRWGNPPRDKSLPLPKREGWARG